MTIHKTRLRHSHWMASTQTLSDRRATMAFGPGMPIELMSYVVIALWYRYPVQVMVQAFRLDERAMAGRLARSSESALPAVPSSAHSTTLRGLYLSIYSVSGILTNIL